MRAPSTDGGPYRATRLLVLFLLHLSPPPVNCRSRKKRHQVRSGQRVAAARESMKQAGRLSGAGRLAEAEQQYAEALRHNPRYLEALGNRAMLLPQLGRAREALAEMKRLVTLAPDQPLVQYNAGLMYAGMQRHDEAIAALGLSADQFAKQEGQEPQRSMALDSLGASMMKLQRVPEALHSFSVAAQVDPAAITPRLNRGAALRERDRAGEASLDYLAALGQAAHDSSAGIIDANTPSLEEVVSDTMYAIEDASWNVHQADKPSLLPLWQRVQTILNALVQQLSVESAKQPPPPAALTQDTLDQVTEVFDARWAANKTALALIRSALAEGRPVHIHGAFKPALAANLTQELVAAARPSGTGGSPIQLHRNIDGDERVVLPASRQRELYTPVQDAHGRRDAKGDQWHTDEASEDVCGEARRIYNTSYQFDVHRTFSQGLDRWLQKQRQAGQSQATTYFHEVLQSKQMATFIRHLLGENAALSSAQLQPSVQGTIYKPGDYLTVHNDLLHLARGGNRTLRQRRVAVVAQLSSANWDTRCGGSLVWCDPFQVLAPTPNSLTLFLTSHWSWHFVEPVYDDHLQALECEGKHRLAWSGWFNQHWEDTVPEKVRLGMELRWLAGRLDAHVSALQRGSHRPTALHLQAAQE